MKAKKELTAKHLYFLKWLAYTMTVSGKSPAILEIVLIILEQNDTETVKVNKPSPRRDD